MRLEYQLEMKVRLYMEKTHGEHVKHDCKSNIAGGMATPTLLNVHIVIIKYTSIRLRVWR